MSLNSGLKWQLIVRHFLNTVHVLSAGLWVLTRSIWLIPTLTFKYISMIIFSQLMSAEFMPEPNMPFFQDCACSHKVWEETNWTASGAVTAFWGMAFSFPVQCHGRSRLDFSCDDPSEKQWCYAFSAV